MKRDTVNYTVVGFFILSMFVLLLVSLYKITGRDAGSVFYYVQYRQIKGIIPGSTVTYGGYQVGRVNRIAPVRTEQETFYRLELAIQEGWPIPKDSKAYIVMPALLSDRQIDIKGGVSREFLPGGALITGGTEADFMEAMKEVAAEINDLSEQTIKPLLAGIQTPLEHVGANLESNIPLLTANLNKLLVNLNDSAEKLNRLMDDQNQAHLAKVFKNADTITTGFAGVADNLGDLQAKMNILLDNSNQVVVDNKDDLREGVIEMRQSMELISQRLNAILYHLESTGRNMNELSRSLREDPGLLIQGVIADKPAQKGGQQ
ncbi:MAG: MlaD family protein [Desulfobulbaceae bacterium]|nr:MlaD family protein [Desulfobulbaceae bacterium]